MVPNGFAGGSEEGERDGFPMFGSELKKIREELGFDSANSFYREFLSKRAPVGFNYSYFMKVEGERALPSPAFVNEIVALLPEERMQAGLIRAYCKSLFPRHARLFNSDPSLSTVARAPRPPVVPAAAGEGALLVRPRFLTEAQVACLSRSRETYYLFLILTLARVPVPVAELRKRIGERRTQAGLSGLVGAKLAHVEGDFAASGVKEMKFPPGDTPSLKKHYAAIDQWNLEFGQEMKFEPVANRMLVRRISRRYSSLILSHTALLVELLKASDEVQQDFNDEVVMFNLSLSRGSLPG